MKTMQAMSNALICDNISFSANGDLLFAGQSAAALAKQYGTPLYLMDEDRIRANIRTYLSAVRAAFGTNAHVAFASKACSFKHIYQILSEEGMYADVVSCGEIYTAAKAGMDLRHALFHSNNKTNDDMEFAIKNNVGLFVVDNQEELYVIDKVAEKHGKVQNILLRLTPGIDPHTYAAVATGKVDSKFGSSITTGQADEMTALALGFENVRLCGYHCHIGSQLFDSSVYLQTVDVMLSFAARMRDKLGFLPEIIDLGGGFGVRYTCDDPTLDIGQSIAEIGAAMKQRAAALQLPMPTVIFEPGRSIVADAGMTLYTVGTVKTVQGYKTYVSVDGGMTDNIRPALYGSKYTVVPATNAFRDASLVCDVAGRCCESGDILQSNVHLPADIQRGETLACFTTGAYHYSMASNYNRIPRPPVVMLKGGKNFVAVRRETFEDLVSLDV